MSRLGKKPISVPNGVTATVNGAVFSVKGAKGELKLPIHQQVRIALEDGGKKITVGVVDEQAILDRALWGLTHKLIRNMIDGVTTGFSKQLELVGVGFKAAVAGANLNLDLGFSHPVTFALPKGVEAKVEKNIITLSGADKQLIGQTAAQIRKLRKPEPYKGKGIRYVGEVVRQKAGKAAKTGAK